MKYLRLFSVLILLGVVLTMASSVQSATGIGFCADLQWNDGANTYTCDIGADTALGETVIVEYTTATKPNAAAALTGGRHESTDGWQLERNADGMCSTGHIGSMLKWNSLDMHYPRDRRC